MMLELEEYGRSHAGGIKSIAFSELRSLLAIGSGDGVIRTWRYENDKLDFCGVLQGHSKAVTALQFSSDGSRLISGGSDGQVIEWGGIPGEQKWSTNVGVVDVLNVRFDALNTVTVRGVFQRICDALNVIVDALSVTFKHSFFWKE